MEPPTARPEFFVGLHQPSDARYFERACICVNRLHQRKAPFQANRWILDSGAFSELVNYGQYRAEVGEYASAARRWIGVGELSAIVAQDYMCEPFILARTGLSVAEHQRLTIERYDRLIGFALPVHVMPVLQGYEPGDYVRHLEHYAERLTRGMWVGVGSVCKRNRSPIDVANVLGAIRSRRPDLRLHGFGVKKTALLDGSVRALIHSADSMAWSYSARKQGRNGNDWREAKAFEQAINGFAGGSEQLLLPLWAGDESAA